MHREMPPYPRRASSHRGGAILIIVAGLASILLVLSVAFMARMRADSQEIRIVMADAQSRLMMHAALMYVQEGSRIGWGDATGECFGWTDVRDGGLGPRGPRPLGASGDGAAIPAPEWYAHHAGWPAFAWNPSDAQLPPVSARRGGWPLPGTATRCPMAVPVVPPYATELTFNYNPVDPPVPYGDPTWESTPWETNYGNFDERVKWPNAWIGTIFNSHAKGMLDPQPVAETWSDFRNGKVDPGASGGDWTHEKFDATGTLVPGAQQQLAVVPGTENQSWFRVYRELQADHDDLDNVGKPGTEWWDKVAMYSDANPADPATPKVRNWSVFIIACGSGATRGYRFWDDAAISAWESEHGLTPGTGRALEPVTAQESGIFSDRGAFEDMLASSRILWFRCEWSGLESGARTMSVYNDYLWRKGAHPFMKDGLVRADGSAWTGWWTQSYQYTAQYATTETRSTAGQDESDTRSDSPKVYAGNIKWLQRLDRDPVIW